MQETLEVVKDFPNLKKDIADARKDMKSGKTILLQDFLKKKRMYDDLLDSHMFWRII